MSGYKTTSAIIILLLCILSESCIKKDPLTRPVRINLKIGISDTTFKNQFLDFSDCIIGIRKIRFEGTREAGGGVAFETDPRKSIPQVVFKGGAAPEMISDFDIPQGVYNSMNWDISFKKILPESEDPETEIPDSLGPGLIVSGTYTDLHNEKIPFFILVDSTELVNLSSFTSDGSSSVTVSASDIYDAIIYFDPGYAFYPISRSSLEDADISDENGTKTIIISARENDFLYQDLLYRLISSAKVIVKHD